MCSSECIRLVIMSLFILDCVKSACHKRRAIASSGTPPHLRGYKPQATQPDAMPDVCRLMQMLMIATMTTMKAMTAKQNYSRCNDQSVSFSVPGLKVISEPILQGSEVVHVCMLPSFNAATFNRITLGL